MTRKQATAYADATSVPLARLHLDPLNPRHDPIADEDAIIAQLVSKEKVLVLARDIAKRGAISPLERTGAVRMDGNPGHYVVVEGNRRLCALKLLRDPRKAPTVALRKQFAAAAKNAVIPASVPVVVFVDRDAAEPWFQLRHLGAQAGAGTRNWNSTQKTRASRGQTPNMLALAVLDRATAAGWLSPIERGQIGITTLTRYLKNPVVRTALGLKDPHELLFTHVADEVDAALKRFVRDALPASDGKVPTVNSRSSASDRKAYGKALIAGGASPRTLLPEPIEPPPPKKTAAAKKRAAQRHPDDSPYVVPRGFVCEHTDRQLQRMLHELRSLQAEEYPFAANYLLRAIIERVLVLFAKKKGVHVPGMTDRKLVEECEKALVADGVSKNETKNMRVAASSEDSTHSLHSLGAGVHGTSLPTRKGLIGVWDNWQGAMIHMLARA